MLIHYPDMRHMLILIFVAISGCTAGLLDSPSSAVPIDERISIVAGDIDVTIGEGRETIAPPGSATAGSKWIEHTVTYTNKSDRPIWIVGYSEASPFSAIESRADNDGECRDYGLGYCGTGAREFEIAPNAQHTFTASLPETYVGHEFRVMLPYRKARNSQQWVQAASQAHRAGNP